MKKPLSCPKCKLLKCNCPIPEPKKKKPKRCQCLDKLLKTLKNNYSTAPCDGYKFLELDDLIRLVEEAIEG